MIDIASICKCFEDDKVLYSSHARQEMLQEELGAITDKEVFEAIQKGETIIQYPDDRPYPSTLIFGLTNRERPIHTVCAFDEDEDRVIVVTVYEPDPNRWIEFRRRRP